jgi:hypothetical protein
MHSVRRQIWLTVCLSLRYAVCSSAVNIKWCYWTIASVHLPCFLCSAVYSFAEFKSKTLTDSPSECLGPPLWGSLHSEFDKFSCHLGVSSSTRGPIRLVSGVLAFVKYSFLNKHIFRWSTNSTWAGIAQSV